MPRGVLLWVSQTLDPGVHASSCFTDTHASTEHEDCRGARPSASWQPFSGGVGAQPLSRESS